ncbi:hypothetical protein V2I01_40350 [Micromonospora sp. BRA006-A]|nr:hypothetical protein [Micromonospora sp. BRA006-A]
MSWATVPQPLLGRCWNSPTESWSEPLPWCGWSKLTRQYVAGQVVEVALLHGGGDGDDQRPAGHLHLPPHVDDGLGVVHLPLVQAGDRPGALGRHGLARRLPRRRGGAGRGGGRRHGRGGGRRDPGEVAGGALVGGGPVGDGLAYLQVRRAGLADACHADQAEAAGDTGGDSDPAGYGPGRAASRRFRDAVTPHSPFG